MRFVTVEDGLPKRENFKLQRQIRNFVDSDISIVRIDFDDGDYASLDSAYRTIFSAVKLFNSTNRNCVRVAMNNGHIYLIRTDM